jgi:hypothetical protein
MLIERDLLTQTNIYRIGRSLYPSTFFKVRGSEHLIGLRWNLEGIVHQVVSCPPHYVVAIINLFGETKVVVVLFEGM